MIDFKDINAAIINALTTVYGAEPGVKRETSLGFEFVLEWSEAAYAKLGLTPLQTGEAYTDLAYQLMRIGYATEANFVALHSDEAVRHLDDVTAQNLMTFNQSILGYTHMVQGEYQAALANFDRVDTLMMSNGFNPMRAVKSFQNKGQILHRMGMSQTIYYAHAMDQFTHAQAVVDRENLAPELKTQFTAQIQYCQAKTMTHLARAATTDGQALAGEAVKQIGAAVESIRGKARFDFDRACFHAVLGDALAVQNKTEMALEYLDSALQGQTQFGPTLAPRIASTLFKIERVKGLAAISFEREAQIVNMVTAFHNNPAHPDVTYYTQQIEYAKTKQAPQTPGL